VHDVLGLGQTVVMRVVPVDPRDTSCERDTIVDHALIWTRLTVPSGIDPDRAGWRSAAQDLCDADVAEVLRWCESAAERAGGWAR
jgi:hypothetical protein